MFRSVSRAWLTLDIVGSVFGMLVTVPLSFLFSAGDLSAWLQSPVLAQILVLVAGAVLWAAAAISRLSPALALVVAWAGAMLQMAGGLPPLPFDIAVFAVLFASGAWGDRRTLWAGGLSTLLGGIVAGLYIALTQLDPGGVMRLGAQQLQQQLLLALLTGTSIVFALIIAWGAGLLWRVVLNGRRTRDAQLRAEAVAAEEHERVRIARDVHDIVAHSLAVVIAQSDGARYAAASDPSAAQAALATIAQTARSALADVRMLLTQLRHRQAEGPQPTLADFEALFAQVRDAGIPLRVTVDPTPAGDPPGSLQLAVYRILQEALTNALRHGARADGVDVRLSWHQDGVDLEVRNRTDGDAAPSGTGHGVTGMRERAQLAGGSLSAVRDAGWFVVRAVLPVGAAGGTMDPGRPE